MSWTSAQVATWYCARSWPTKAPWLSSTKVSLHQRHAQAHGHAADELRPGQRRVDDPPGGEHTEQPRHPDLAGAGVDVDLGELGAERVPGEVGIGRHILRGVAAAHGRPHSSAGPRTPSPPPNPSSRCPSTRRRGRRAAARCRPARPGPGPVPAPRASAAIWVSAVRAPVPMSAAAMRTTKPPSWAMHGRPRRLAAGRVGGRGHAGAGQPPPVAARRRAAGRGRPSRTGGPPRAGRRPGSGS